MRDQFHIVKLGVKACTPLEDAILFLGKTVSQAQNYDGTMAKNIFFCFFFDSRKHKSESCFVLCSQQEYW